MKKIHLLITLLFSAIILFNSGCKKDDASISGAGLCLEPQCQDYFDIWKKYFLDVNKMSEDYYNEHITPYETFVESWESGESFKIRYKVKISWLEIDVRDEFLIRIDSKENKFPQLNLPKGKYLDDEQVTTMIDNYAFNSKVTHIASIDKLNFSSEKRALKALRDATGQKNLEFRRYEFKDARLVFTPNGNPFMYGVIETSDDVCACGEIDLVTGEGGPYECACEFN